MPFLRTILVGSFCAWCFLAANTTHAAPARNNYGNRFVGTTWSGFNSPLFGSGIRGIPRPHGGGGVMHINPSRLPFAPDHIVLFDQQMLARREAVHRIQRTPVKLTRTGFDISPFTSVFRGDLRKDRAE